MRRQGLKVPSARTRSAVVSCHLIDNSSLTIICECPGLRAALARYNKFEILTDTRLQTLRIGRRSHHCEIYVLCGSREGRTRTRRGRTDSELEWIESTNSEHNEF